jgi:peptidoglycan hydrolase CwlO-like protein
MFRKAGQVISKLIEAVHDKTKESKAKAKAKPAQIIEDNGIEFGVLPDSAYGTYFEESQNETLAGEVKSKRTWQVVALFSMVFLFAALFANMWFYMDRRIQLDRLDQAYATIRSVYGDFIEADQRADALQNELTNSKAEVGRINSELSSSRAEVTRIQNRLDSSEAELRTVQNELAEARQDLETAQRHNAEAVAKLNAQIQKLVAWIKGVTKSP